MDKILNDIFIKNNFWLEENEEITIFRNNTDFFIVENYNLNEFINFFKSEKTDLINEIFFELTTSNSDYRKSTTLIILIKVDDLEKFYINHRKQLMKIEEDQFFYRKAVIFYDNESIDEFKYVPEDVIDEIENKTNIEKFEEDLFFSSKYLVSMLLMIKLPFLQLREGQNEFNTLTDLLESKLDEKKLSDVDKNLQKVTPELIVEFIEEINKETSNQNLLKEFYNIFDITDDEV